MYSQVLIFGGTGSLGTSLIKNWSQGVGQFYVYSRDEYKQFLLKQKFPQTKFILGDIYDYKKVKDTILNIKPSLIIIASAMKHIDKCQEYTQECLNTNITGLLNVLNAVKEIHAISNSVSYPKKIIFVSTDKACQPITIYGMSKGISEHIIQTFNADWGENGPKLLAVRYGNVINSNGSIIPIFKNQALNSNQLTVTHPDMTRFYMTLEESVQLIKDAVDHGGDREIWIPILKSMKIMDLATLYSKKYEKPIVITGLRCREKIHEMLISSEEFNRVTRLNDRYIIHANPVDRFMKSIKYKSSENLFSIEELEEKLKEYL